MLGYDATQDTAQNNPSAHWRIWFSPRKQALVTINVQDFDYFDYFRINPDGFVDYTAYDTQDDAQRGLALILAVVNAVAAAAA